MRRILVTGALGQIGADLIPALVARHGVDAVVASDIRMLTHRRHDGEPRHEHVDCLDAAQLRDVVRHWNVGTIYHLAALLSAVAEQRPQDAWRVNMDGLVNVLEVARQHGCALFFPSSIAAFGPGTPPDATPQDTTQRPSSMYGITKVSGEMLCDYYARRFGVDARGLRLPGLVSHGALPGGGTTDYAVEIFHHALAYGRYTCFLRADTRLDMMYMPDAIRAMLELMAADATRLAHRNAFNIAAISLTPAELGAAIASRIPGFEIRYEVDPVRQAIADSWPHSVDDRAARSEWGWRPAYTLDAMVDAMIAALRARREAGRDDGVRPPGPR